jgi:hypothetical protein
MSMKLMFFDVPGAKPLSLGSNGILGITNGSKPNGEGSLIPATSLTVRS